MLVFASQGRSNRITEIIRNSFHLCLTEPPSEKAYRLISLPDSELSHDMVADCRSPSAIGCKLAKESETRLSCISECAGLGDRLADFPLSRLFCYRPPQCAPGRAQGASSKPLVSKPSGPFPPWIPPAWPRSFVLKTHRRAVGHFLSALGGSRTLELD